MTTMVGVMWCSKDRFATKRLRSLSNELQPEKKAVIAANSAFSVLLNVSPFNIPDNLNDFVARHITPSLREFKYHRNRIVFNKYMVRKVFGIRCGNMPVQLLKKSDNSELRDVYKEANSRPDLHVAITLLKDCEITDVDTIVRTWDLICLATVVDPGSGNMFGLEYTGSMANPSRTHEYAWDEYFLELAMVEVQKIQKKMGEPVVPKKSEFWITGPFAMLGIVYMDHLDFAPNSHVIKYSTPRVCHITSKDFMFAAEVDLDRKILNNKSVFGRRPFLKIADTPYGGEPDVLPQEGVEAPVEQVDANQFASLNDWLVFPGTENLEVPARFKHLHDKHKAIFATDVDTSMKNFAAGLKNMHSHRIARLLIDVEAAIKEEDVVSVDFPAGTKKSKDASIPDDEESEKQSNASGAPGDANAATNDEEEDDEAPIVQLAEDSEETDDDDDMAEAANQFQVLKHIS